MTTSKNIVTKELTADYKKKFLETLAGSGHISSSAALWGFSPRRIASERKRDPSFDEAVTIAQTKAHMELEGEARRRALHGVERTKYYRGQVIGTEIEYSDKLLMFLMQATDPARYGRSGNTSVNINQTVNVDGETTLTKLNSFLKIDMTGAGEANTPEEDVSPDAIDGEFEEMEEE